MYGFIEGLDTAEQRLALTRQVGGNHYKDYAVPPVEFAMRNNLNTCQANVVKYVCRYKDKGGREDLLKARHYIDLLLEYEYGEGGAACSS